MKYTPGPWAIMEYFPLDVVRERDKNKKKGAASDPISDEKEYGQSICNVCFDEYSGPEFVHRMINFEESEANARLIAAAPDLLEACKNAIAYLQEYNCQRIKNCLRQAIAKAEGREENHQKYFSHEAAIKEWSKK